MVFTIKVVLTAAMALSFVMQMLLICSANANPIEEFFFVDQPKIVEKRFVEKKNSGSILNALKPISNGTDSEDEGSGVGPQEGSGSEIFENSGNGAISTPVETNTELHISNLPQETTAILQFTDLTGLMETTWEEETIVGSGDGAISTPVETNTELHISNLPQETTAILQFTDLTGLMETTWEEETIVGSGDGAISTPVETNTELPINNLPHETTAILQFTDLTEQTETTKKEEITDGTSIMPTDSSVTKGHESSDKETTLEVSTSLAESSKTEHSTITLGIQENISSSTEDPSQLSTQSEAILQTSIWEETEGEAFSTGMTDFSASTIGTEEPHPKLVSIQVCGKQFYCLAGRRGPCQPNEILVEDISNDTLEASTHCSALSSFPWRGCMLSVNEETAATTSVGRCNLKSTKQPCSGYPSNYRFHPITKMCRPTSKSTGNWLADECGDDQVLIGFNHNLGSCICLNKKHLVYTGDNQCYQPYIRGPCNKGMWLVPSTRREMDCRISPCPVDQIDGKHFYWNGNFHGPAGCYRSNTRGPCPEGRTFIVDNYVSGHARCERDENV
ncbi:serine protease nudel-like [Daphnia carinata]|uniref:serine protease nudel-like n=1 Tax=Daphnia carinata TaxID=120202 RepID=UPI00257B99FC|nr:serine protease nudel-like [Daphnia carinata]